MTTSSPQADVRLVPVEPTPEMIESARVKSLEWGACLPDDVAKVAWSAMLAAAPVAPAGTEGEKAVMVCPQCDGEGEYADGLDEAACSTPCTRCDGNGWLVDLQALAARAQPPAVSDGEWERAVRKVSLWIKCGMPDQSDNTPSRDALKRDLEIVLSAARAKPPGGEAEPDGWRTKGPRGGWLTMWGNLKPLNWSKAEPIYLRAHPAEPAARPQTAAELTSIIRAWLDADDPLHWGPFERRLDAALAASGEK